MIIPRYLTEPIRQDLKEKMVFRRPFWNGGNISIITGITGQIERRY